MKRILFTLLLPVVCGAAGFCLRRQQLLTGFESTGLAVPGNGYALLLIALSLVTAAVCLLLCLRCKRTPQSYSEAFASTGNAFYLFFVLLAAVLLLAAAVLGLRELMLEAQGGASVSWLQILLWCMCLVSAVCVLTVALGNFRYSGRRSTGRQRQYSLALLALPYTGCLWLIAAYQQVSADPVVLSYIYQILAIICVLLATYFIASFSFQRPRPRLCLMFSLLGIYLSIVTLADGHDWPTRLLLLASILYLSHTALMLMTNILLPPPQEQPAGQSDHEETMEFLDQMEEQSQ
ncbi:MAG: hypothetical protein LUF80_02440 [Oscillospiraceae bacterium]|nr:hypothetical protein [Oscillospiraceae bacterium]